jgi:hypothetical protein
MASTKEKKPKNARGPRAAPAVDIPQLPLEVDLGPPNPTVARNVLDQILALQLVVAWAGEAKSDPPRLGWWRTSLVDEFGGEDLFRRLTPRTWKWAVFEAARIAARSVDATARSHAADGDQLRSLFHFGFAVDEQLDDRLSELKRSTQDPVEALPELARTSDGWDATQFVTWLATLAPVVTAPSSVGRRLKAEPPEDLAAAARMLAAAMAPITERYPAPHFKVEG